MNNWPSDYFLALPLLCIVLTFFVIMYGLGKAVLIHCIKVNYTRKIVHFSMFLMPSLFFEIYGVEKNYDRMTITAISCLLIFIGMTRPLRTLIKASEVAFLSIDRPEDRPFSLWWLVSQTIMGLSVLFMYCILWKYIDIPYKLLYLTVLVTTFGDGLAEPVGVKFGRHPYQSKGFLVKRYYKRTWEGSATVFVCAVILCICYSRYFSMLQSALLLTVYPAAVTLTEAKSPHTWDTPFLFLIGNLIVTCVYSM